MTSSRLATTLSVFMTALCLGCGEKASTPDLGTVTGTVMLDGAPLAEADVMFQPVTGRPSMGKTDAKGSYDLTYLQGIKGAIIGEHKVIIRTEIAGNDGEPPVQKEKLPAKYHNKSELTANVVAGKNTFNFNLESK